MQIASNLSFNGGVYSHSSSPVFVPQNREEIETVAASFSAVQETSETDRAAAEPKGRRIDVTTASERNTDAADERKIENRAAKNVGNEKNQAEVEVQERQIQERQKKENQIEARRENLNLIEEQKVIQQLSQRDREVRAHEQAHTAVGGQYAGSPSYTYSRGPDGVSYARGGEVSISSGAVAGDPQATLQKAETVKRAALAPAQPSGQDRRVAAGASQMAIEARSEIVALRAEEIAQDEEGKLKENEENTELEKTQEQETTSRVDGDENGSIAVDTSAEKEDRNVASELINADALKLNKKLVDAGVIGLNNPIGALLNAIA